MLFFLYFSLLSLSGRRDSNPESPLPKRGMLAVTPRPDLQNTLLDIYISTLINVARIS